jgi:hypothetical protein
MLQMILPLTRSSRLCTFQLLGLEMFQVRLQKKKTLQHKGLVCDRSKIKYIC